MRFRQYSKPRRSHLVRPGPGYGGELLDLRRDVESWGDLAHRPEVVTEDGATRTLAEDDDGRMIRCTLAGGCEITVPTGLPLGWTCTVVQAAGAGSVTVVSDGTVTLEAPASAASPVAVGEEGALIGITVVDASSGADVALVYGNLA